MSAAPGFCRIALIGCTFLALNACGHMPVTSMVKLARIDLQTTDPKKLRVAVKLPLILQTRAEGTVLRLTVRPANGASEARNFALRAVNEGEALAGEREHGTVVSTFALAVRDVAELRMFRAALIQKQKGGSGGSVTIAVQPDACRTGALPEGPVLFSTFLMSAETNGYVPLARDIDLRTLAPGQDILAKIPPC